MLFSVRWDLKAATLHKPELLAMLMDPLRAGFRDMHRYALLLDAWESRSMRDGSRTMPPTGDLREVVATMRSFSGRMREAMLRELSDDAAVLERRARAYEFEYSASLLLAVALTWVVLRSLISREKHELERLRSAIELDLREARFQSIFAESSLAIAIIDLDGSVLESNGAYRRLVGRELNAVSEPERIFDGVEVRPQLAIADVLHALRSGVASITGTDLEITDSSGRRAWYEMNASSVATATQTAKACSIALRDITERKIREEQLRHDVLHDLLIGLGNRASLIAELEASLATAPVSDLRFALLYVDVDDFKSINDTLGRSGDDCLQVVARRLLDVTREGDRVAQIGGDEFVVLLWRLEIRRRRGHCDAPPGDLRTSRCGRRRARDVLGEHRHRPLPRRCRDG